MISRRSRRSATAAINVLGGTAVLGSYAWCLTTYPSAGADFWGGVPEALRPVYTANMFLAAAGYFAFTFFVMYRLQTAAPGADGRPRVGLGAFNALYGLILVPSALWMPLTFAMLEAPSDWLWWIIRATLFAVGLGSLGLLACLVAARPPRPAWAHRLAVVGAVAFCTQTVLLDAILWPAFFPV